MHAYLKKILSLTSLLVAATLTGTAAAPAALSASASGSEPGTVLLTVNDSELGDAPFTFSFSASWVHEGGYPDRFEGGDEHWTTTAQFGNDYPSFTFRFVGSEVSLYGHKVPAGAMADVSVDGTVVGRIDYYNASRIERTLLWESGELAYGEHTVKVQLVAEQNPAASGTHEASVDYAVVRTSEEQPATGIELHSKNFILEKGMTYTLTYSFLPAYATETPEVIFTSSDPSVATVDREGRITAVSPGKAAITVAPVHGDYKDSLVVTVRNPVGGKLVAHEGSTNRHVRQDEYYDRLAFLKTTNTTELTAVAWRSDIATAKIDLLTKDLPCTNVRAEVGELINAHGDVLDATVTVEPVRDTLAHDSGHLVPDVIGGGGSYDLPAYSVGALWLTLYTPADALPGTYTAPVTVTDDAGNTTELSLSLEVIGLTRPENTVALELWQYPYSSNRYYSGKTTAEYFGEGMDGVWHTHLDPAYTEALRSQIELYAAAGGNTVTVTINEDPWNSQTPDPYPSMIKWTRETDGSFTFDYTDFDYWVSLNESCGVTGGIMSFSIADWANRVTYFDKRSSSVRSETLSPGSERWRAVWTEFLTDYMAHTTERGWFDRVYLSMDERPAEVVEAVLDLVESVRNGEGKCFKTSLAVFSFETEHLFDRVTDLSLAIYMDAAKLQTITAHRRAAGLTTTLYTCGAQFSALENPPYESLYGMWYCEWIGADGFLRWALDAFNDDPLRESTHRLFAAGDIYLFYPDEKNAAHPTARTSPRFEKLAEGCRDISKLRYLRELSRDNAEHIDTHAFRRFADGGATETAVSRAQDIMNALARRSALELAVAEARTAAVADPAALASALDEAETLLSTGSWSDKDCVDATYTLMKLLQKAGAAETDTAPVETGSESETVGETVAGPIEEPATEAISETAAEASSADKGGCTSTLAGAAVPGIAVAAVALRRKKSDD